MSKKNILVSNKTLVNFAVVSVLVISIVFLVQSISENEDLLNNFVLVYYTDFEDAEKVDDRHLNLPVNHYFNFAGRLQNKTWAWGEDGARFWVEDSFAYSGNKCIGMELFDITKALRNEFIIYDAHKQLGEEIFVSVWLYLPSDWMLYSPTLRWYEIQNPFIENNPPNWVPKLHFHVSQTTLGEPTFNVYLMSRDKDNNISMLSHNSNFPLPRGRWFQVSYYLLRHPSEGVIKIWMDGELVCDKSDVVTKEVTDDYSIVVAKIYHETDDTTTHRIYVDDLELWSRVTQ